MATRGNRPTKEETLEHERQAWALRQHGWTHERIAEEIGLTREAVSRLFARLDKRALKELDGQVQERKIEQDSLLRHILDESMQAWERSKQNAQSVVKKTVPGEDADGKQIAVETVTMTIEGQVGDPAYLDEARATLADLRKLWGLDEATKIEGTVRVLPAEEMSDEDLLRIARGSGGRSDPPATSAE